MPRTNSSFKTESHQKNHYTTAPTLSSSTHTVLKISEPQFHPKHRHYQIVPGEIKKQIPNCQPNSRKSFTFKKRTKENKIKSTFTQSIKKQHITWEAGNLTSYRKKLIFTKVSHLRFPYTNKTRKIATPLHCALAKKRSEAQITRTWPTRSGSLRGKNKKFSLLYRREKRMERVAMAETP